MAFQLDIKDNAKTQDTVDAIILTINKTSKEGFAPQLAIALNPNSGGSKLEYIKRLFEFVCKNVEYKMDPAGWEKIYTPARLFLEAQGDCKKMTTAISSVLKAAGIEPLLKIISYDGYNWSHIYVLAKIGNKYYVLDPVNKKTFDSEINHKHAAVYNLNGNFKIMPGTKLSILGNDNTNASMFKSFDSGLNELCGDLDNAGAMLSGEPISTITNDDIDALVSHFEKGISGIGISGIGKLKLAAKLKNVIKHTVTAIKQDVHKAGVVIKKDIKKIEHGVVKVAGAIPRAAFLGLLLLGKALEKTPIKMHLAAKMAEHWKRDNGKELSAMWTKFGGNPDELKKVIIKSSGTQIAGIGMGDLAAVAASITAATPLLVTVHKVLKDAGIIKEGSTDDKNLTVVSAAGIEAHNDDGSLSDATKNQLPEQIKSGGITELNFNTFVKAIFLICISPMIPGILFYILNFVCITTIILYLLKFYKYEIQI